MKKQLGLILGTVLGIVLLAFVWNPLSSLATEADPTTAGAQDVDYDVIVQSQDGELNLRSGPGAEYAHLYTHHNGDVLHIYKVKNAASGNPWGYTAGGPNKDIVGWVALAPTSRVEEQQEATPEEETVSAEAPVTSEEPATSEEETVPEEVTSEEVTTSEEEPGTSEEGPSEEPETSEEAPAADSTESAISAAPSIPPSAEDLPAEEEPADNNYVLSRAIAGIAIIAAAVVAMRILHVRNTRRRRRRR